MVIINGRIFTMEGEPIQCGFVRINGEKIEEVGGMDCLESVGDNEEILDVHGAWVLPGLIDAHSHIGITEEKWGVIGDDCNEQTTPVSVYENPGQMYRPYGGQKSCCLESGIWGKS